MKTNLIAEIGINFAYGNDKTKFVQNAKDLIDLAYLSGCKFVKFQKRNPYDCVPENQRDKPKTVPWNKKTITYLEYKKDIEFDSNDYSELFEYSTSKGLTMFSSAWDIKSADFLSRFSKIVKIPSAHLTNYELLEYCRDKFLIKMLSTGMSTEEEIEKAVEILEPSIIFHTNSSYPSPVNELNLKYITQGHEYGLSATLYAIVLGAVWIERHITLSHDLWGSDQKASVEPRGLFELKTKIAELHEMMGGDKNRVVFESEIPKRESLRNN